MDRNLSTKYRPEFFNDIVGQEHVKLILEKQIKEDNLRSAYLFVGSSGCGKTTSARCMARSINGSLAGLVEIDAASNSGVDSVRELTELSKFKSIGYKKKIYIIDECFHGNTLVNTPSGKIKISELAEGDLIYNFDGASSINKVFKNVVSLERLCLVTINNKEVLTTVDHLFFTLDGWVEAKNLREGDVVIDYESMSKLWICPKDDRCQASKWYAPCVGGEEPRGEWEVHSTSATSSSIIGSGVDFRISDTNQMSKKSTCISNLLQSRPRLTKIKDSDRGGWQDTSKEISTTSRLKEKGMSNQFRVENIKIYERGSNEQYFSSYISDKERDDGFIILYDLEVVGHPSYFVDDILVHNCHSLSSAAFQAFLKTIEDGVKDVIFVFCTTERHKVPATIVSRCQVFDFQRITSLDIRNRLQYIQNAENKEFGEDKYNVSVDGLDYISKLANGGMRLAISMYEKVINCYSSPSLDDITEILGTSSYKDMFEIVDCVYNRDCGNLIKIIERINSQGKDFKRVTNDFVDFILELTKYSYTTDMSLVSIPTYYLETLVPYDINFMMELIDGLIDCTNIVKSIDNPKNYLLGKLLQLC